MTLRKQLEEEIEEALTDVLAMYYDSEQILRVLNVLRKKKASEKLINELTSIIKEDFDDEEYESSERDTLP